MSKKKNKRQRKLRKNEKLSKYQKSLKPGFKCKYILTKDKWLPFL